MVLHFQGAIANKGAIAKCAIAKCAIAKCAIAKCAIAKCASARSALARPDAAVGTRPFPQGGGGATR